ncbi:MAG: glycosyltransferase family 4 protein [Methanomicrobiales archaeon]
MRIAQVTHRYYPNVGGIETYIKEISERMAEDHEIEVITADFTPPLKTSEIHNGVKITRFSSIKWKNSVYFSPYIKGYLEESRFDVIHAHNYHALPALSASKSADNNLIFSPHYHGQGSRGLTNVLLRPYWYFGRRIFQKARKIICDSEYEKLIIKRDFTIDNSRISVIPLGINLQSIQNTQPFENMNNLVLYVGRLDGYKNIDLVIRAMQYLPDFKFYIIGKSGNYKKQLLNLIISLKLSDRVKILDNISDENKNRWLKTCSIFVNFSDIEAYGITVLEAVAAGKPVIVNNVGGLAELASQFTQILPIRREDYHTNESLKELASLMKTASGHEYQPDLKNYDWGEVSKRVKNEYLLLLEK